MFKFLHIFGREQYNSPLSLCRTISLGGYVFNLFTY